MGVDRLSELPDCILLHIMSFMDTRYAVQTCVLSKRWKNLCKCLTNLTFYCIYERVPRNFHKFVSWVLTSRDDSCPVLILEIGNWVDVALLERVTKYALFHGVQQLDIKMNSRIGFTFESLSLIFTCHTLTSLTFCTLFGNLPKIILPKSLHMPALKNLHLKYVNFSASDNDCAEPFSNCHVLNTLVLEHCSLHDHANVLSISNSSLYSLTIYSLITEQDNEIVLSTPNLVSCTVVGFFCHKFSSTYPLSSLEEVNISEYSCLRTSSTVIRWLQVLANVKILTLTVRILQLIQSDLSNPSLMTPKPPCFIRLESLKVTRQFGGTMSDEEITTAVDHLLQNSPTSKVNIVVYD